jgi:hypothetical protein
LSRKIERKLSLKNPQTPILPIPRSLRHSKDKSKSSIYRAMKQSILILIALWGLIGTILPTEKAKSENPQSQVEREQVTEIATDTR